MSTTVESSECLQVDLEIVIKAPASKAFKAMVQQFSEKFGPDGNPMPLKLELFPGGRWFRDLGDNQGHLWGHVQVIKQDKLLEISGPFFMSYPAINHLQVRLTPEGDSTRVTLKHHAIGSIDPQHRDGVTQGWQSMLDALKKSIEGR